jgi:hypothetical protein
MSVHFSLESQDDMGYHDWEPCELYPQTEQSFDAHDEGLDLVPAVTGAGGSCDMTRYSPAFTVGNMSDALIESELDLPAGRRRSSGMSGGNRAGAAEDEVVLPADFWQPNMLYEKRRW